MAKAYKCDICGKLYEGQKGALAFDDYNKVNVVVITMSAGKTKLDACQNCCRKYAKKLINYYDAMDKEEFGM